MGMPTDIGIIDTMIGFPMRDTEAVYEFIKKQTKDADSKQSAFPAEYMFKQAPKQGTEGDEDPVGITLRDGQVRRRAAADRRAQRRRASASGREGAPRPLHPVDEAPTPMTGSYGLRSDHGQLIRGCSGSVPSGCSRAGTFPQVAINDKLMYPIYAKCWSSASRRSSTPASPAPLKYEPQKVEYLDEVMFDFPELVLVTRHGCEPWTSSR